MALRALKSSEDSSESELELGPRAGTGSLRRLGVHRAGVLRHIHLAAHRFEEAGGGVDAVAFLVPQNYKNIRLP